MKILLAPDKFKGSLSAQEVCQALTKGIHSVDPTVEIFQKPLADGGDGSLEVLQHYFDLATVTITVHDPLMRPIRASYKIAQQTAYIEMAAASGLMRLKHSEQNPLHTSTFGTGELIADALRRGSTTIYLFIGGSATNDGGIGMANALGYRFYDDMGQLLSPIGKNLAAIAHIDSQHVPFDWQKIRTQVICDVDNPFYGDTGAAYTYARQKGANDEEIVFLDRGLQHLATLLKRHRFPDITTVAGAGAAGGLGGGAIAFLNAYLVSGIQTFLSITQLEEVLKDCDIVITGEGKLDRQTEQGKVISGVCALAQKYKKPVIAVCGDVDFPIAKTLQIDTVYTIRSRSSSMTDAMENAADKLEQIGPEILVRKG